ncbi:hypothetical protein V6N13_064339 [Hibiscus sabdariffa]|uniref:PGG domain-containing protein n=1 Tax=Hibiscus sabdariffa TaxID=183260 RepID=A0ABR2E9R3_9ROSI
MNPSAAYVRDKDRGMTALHMAAWIGGADIMQYIISNCPGCCEIVDDKGWNFLHYAAVALQPREFQRVLSGDDKRSMIKDLPTWKLLYEKDVNGNTPVDVFYLFSHSRRSGFSTVFSFLQNQGFEQLMSDSDANYAKKKKQIREIVNEIGNNEGLAGIPPNKYFREDIGEDDIPSLKEIVDNLRETHLVVAALVATVTFAAAIAVPGGYKTDKGSDEGTATLSSNSDFKAFIITDALAFVSSLLAIFLHFLCVFIDLKVAKSAVLNWILMADGLTVFAMAAMVVSFSAGTYAVLESSMGIAIATCSIGLAFFPFSIIVPLFIYHFFKPDH